MKSEELKVKSLEGMKQFFTGLWIGAALAAVVPDRVQFPAHVQSVMAGPDVVQTNEAWNLTNLVTNVSVMKVVQWEEREFVTNDGGKEGHLTWQARGRYIAMERVEQLQTNWVTVEMVPLADYKQRLVQVGKIVTNELVTLRCNGQTNVAVFKVDESRYCLEQQVTNVVRLEDESRVLKLDSRGFVR